WAVKPIISRNRSASELFSRSVRRVMISSVIVGSSVRLWFSDQTLPMIRDDHRKPLARYGATGARSLAACSAELHHQLGRDPCLRRRCPVLHDNRIVRALQLIHWRIMGQTSIDS